jgi:hypothetical protein
LSSFLSLIDLCRCRAVARSWSCGDVLFTSACETAQVPKHISDESLAVILTRYPLDKTQILDLSASRVRISEESVARMCSLPCLRSLILNECRISDGNLLPLTLLADGLHELQLAECREVTDVGVMSLSRALTSLNSLNLRQCRQVSDVGVMSLTTLVHLTHLNLERCSEITDASLRSLSCLSCLQSLILEDCRRVTNQGAQHCARRQTHSIVQHSSSHHRCKLLVCIARAAETECV